MIHKIGCADNYRYKRQTSFKGQASIFVNGRFVSDKFAGSILFSEKQNALLNRVLKYLFIKSVVLKKGTDYVSEDLTQLAKRVIVTEGVEFASKVTGHTLAFRHYNNPQLDVKARRVMVRNTTLGEIDSSKDVGGFDLVAKSVKTNSVAIAGENNHIGKIDAFDVEAQNLTADEIKADRVQTYGKCRLGTVEADLFEASEGTKVVTNLSTETRCNDGGLSFVFINPARLR